MSDSENDKHNIDIGELDMNDISEDLSKSLNITKDMLRQKTNNKDDKPFLSDVMTSFEMPPAPRLIGGSIENSCFEGANTAASLFGTPFQNLRSSQLSQGQYFYSDSDIDTILAVNNDDNIEEDGDEKIDNDEDKSDSSITGQYVDEEFDSMDIEDRLRSIHEEQKEMRYNIYRITRMAESILKLLKKFDSQFQLDSIN